MGKASNWINLLTYDLSKRSFFHVKNLKPHQHIIVDVSSLFHQVVYNAKSSDKITAYDIWQKVTKFFDQNLESHWGTLEQLVLIADDKYHTPVNKNRDKGRKPEELSKEQENAIIFALAPVLSLPDPALDAFNGPKMWKQHFIPNEDAIIRGCMTSPLIRFILECIVSRCCHSAMITLNSRIRAGEVPVRVIYDGLSFCTTEKIEEIEGKVREEMEKELSFTLPDEEDKMRAVCFRKTAKRLCQSLKTFYIYDSETMTHSAFPQYYTLVGESDIRQVHYVIEAGRQKKTALVMARDHDYALVLLVNFEAWDFIINRDIADADFSSSEIVNVTLDVLRGRGSDDDKQCINANTLYDDLKRYLLEKKWKRFPITSFVGVALIGCKGDYLNGFTQLGEKRMWDSITKGENGAPFGCDFIDFTIDEPTESEKTLNDDEEDALSRLPLIEDIQAEFEPNQDMARKRVFVITFATPWVTFLRKFYNELYSKAIREAVKEKRLTPDMLEDANEEGGFTDSTGGRRDRREEENGEDLTLYSLNSLSKVLIDLKTNKSRCPDTSEITSEIYRVWWNLNYYINGWKSIVYSKNAIQTSKKTNKSLWGWTRNESNKQAVETGENAKVVQSHHFTVCSTSDIEDLIGVSKNNFRLFMKRNELAMLTPEGKFEVGGLDTLEEHIKRVIDNNPFLGSSARSIGKNNN